MLEWFHGCQERYLEIYKRNFPCREYFGSFAVCCSSIYKGKYMTGPVADSIYFFRVQFFLYLVSELFRLS